MDKEDAKLTADIRVYCDPRLKALAVKESLRRKIPLSELVVQALAAFLDREDLAEVPRMPPGRPLKEAAESR